MSIGAADAVVDAADAEHRRLVAHESRRLSHLLRHVCAQLTQTVQLANAGMSSYVVENLSPGTYYFAVRAYTSGGAESANSNVVTKSRAVIVAQTCGAIAFM